MGGRQNAEQLFQSHVFFSPFNEFAAIMADASSLYKGISFAHHGRFIRQRT
jgi:hypothetical protein